ncbi:hypothetical protein B9Z55_004987 [Caenorhabditis nigoni]|nr:hypothetical protein B9Z55_004987 [Caenorhabditis nigoni]
MAIPLEVQGKLLGQPSVEDLEKCDFANVEKHLQEIFEVDIYARELNVSKEKFNLADFPNSKKCEKLRDLCRRQGRPQSSKESTTRISSSSCFLWRNMSTSTTRRKKDPRSINGPIAKTTLAFYSMCAKDQGFTDLYLYAQCPDKEESFILNVHPKWHNPLGQVAWINCYRKLLDQMLKNGEIENVQVFEDLGLVYNNYEDLEKFPFCSKSLWSRIISYCYPGDEYFGENMHEAMTEHAKDNFFIRLCNEKPDSIPEVGKLSVVPMARTQESFFHFCANKDKILEFSTQRHMKYSSQVIIKAVADAQKKNKKNHENTMAPLDSVSNPPVSSFQHFEITFKKCPLLKLIFF